MDPFASFVPNTTLGALEIGILVSYALFGVTTTQTYIYYTRFPDDSPKIKALVAFIWVCEAAHAICIGHSLYDYTITNYVHPLRLLGAAPKSFDTAIFFGAVIIACVQGFFAFRIYTLSKILSISLLIWVMVLFRLLGSIVIFIEALGMTFLVPYEEKWAWLLTAIWSVSTANDLTITTTLVVLLHNQRNNLHRRTAALVDKLITWTIETGMLTSALSVATLACFVAMQRNFIWVSMFAVNARLFSNSLLARQVDYTVEQNDVVIKRYIYSLNSRTTLRAMDQFAMPSLTPTTARGTGTDAKVPQFMYNNGTLDDV
ncbi:hypothetical protein B0H13DRAFT_2318976 [Mycena leptocephala]|nr:hypothetical protein B0H13DRAFT_2318976 [Mycena leptocephala]